MASHRAPKVAGRAATTVAVVGATAGTVVLMPGTSQASPTQSLTQVKAEVQQLNNQAEAATNQYDAAKEQYAKLQQRVDGLQAQITQEQAALDTLQNSMGMQAAAQYQSRGISPSLQLALSDVLWRRRFAMAHARREALAEDEAVDSTPVATSTHAV